MLNEEFDHIVSLGSFCQTVHHIRRYFGVGKAQVFDWWVTPTIGLVEILESNFSDLFLAENMRIVHEDAGDAVMCARYGLMHYHDFYEAKVDGTPAPFLVRAALAGNLSKFAHLLRRFYTLKGKVLFIRRGSGYVQHYPRNADFNSELIRRFTAALEKCLPEADFKVLLLNSEYNGFDDARCIADTVEDYGVTQWYGSDQGWDELFCRLGIRLRQANESVAEDGAVA